MHKHTVTTSLPVTHIVTHNKLQTCKHMPINTHLYAPIYTGYELPGPEPAVCEHASPLICGLVGASSKVSGPKKA